MVETNSVVDETVIDGDLWLRGLVKGHVFRKSAHTVSLCRYSVPREVHVLLPGRHQLIVVIPRGANVIFYQPYPATNRNDKVVAILLQDEQIVINGDGRIFRKRH